MASSVLLYKKDSACWWASPNPPRTVLRTGCAPDRSGTFFSGHFAANKKEGRQQPHDCHLPVDHSFFIHFSSFIGILSGRIPLFQKLLQCEGILIILIIDFKIIVCTFAQ